MRLLFAADCFINSVSALAQHQPVHKRSHAAGSAEAQGLHGVTQHDHETLIDRVSAGSPIWTKCTEANYVDVLWPVDAERCLAANLIFVRIHKTGTSTLGGVLRRIAARRGLNGAFNHTAEGLPEPMVSTDHFYMAQWKTERFVKRHGHFSKPNIVVTLVREPVERWLSNFYYRISKSDPEGPFDLLTFLKTFALNLPNYEANFLSTTGQPGRAEHKDGSVDVDAVLQNYPLVGVTERFEESMVALTFELGIDSFCDVLYVDAKHSETALNKDGQHFKAHIPYDKQPDKIKAYIQSSEFQKSIASDKELYEKANKRLDLQIFLIGKKRFEMRLNKFARWLKLAQETCDADGEINLEDDCFYDDMGCKRKCLDKFCVAHGDALKLDTHKPMFDIFNAPLILNDQP